MVFFCKPAFKLAAWYWLCKIYRTFFLEETIADNYYKRDENGNNNAKKLIAMAMTMKTRVEIYKILK